MVDKPKPNASAKPFPVALVVTALIVGGSIGIAQTWAEFRGVRERFEPNDGSVSFQAAAGADPTKAKIPPNAGSKVLVENGERFNFGQIERRGEMSHQFVFKNIGTATLHIETVGTSCSMCTVAGVEKSTLEPGQTSIVTVDWTAQQMEPDFHKEAYIATSDPDNRVVRLIIEGEVVSTMGVYPSQVVFSNLPTNIEDHRTTMLCSRREEKLEVVNFTMDNLEIADFFTLEFTPAPEDVALKQKAKQAIEITVHVKPGMPLGLFTQTVHLKTNLPESAPLEFSIKGTVVSDISLIGGSYNTGTGLLSMGSVSRIKGAKTSLRAIVKGPHRNDIQMKVTSIEPEGWLQADIGEPTPFGEGAVMLPITVEIPPGRETINRLGGEERSDYGRIMIETNHPDTKVLRIMVRFAVTD